MAGYRPSARRTSPLPRQWPALRRHALRACGGRCQWVSDDGTRCSEGATDVDHIVPASEGGGDHAANLQGLCKGHHDVKTGREGGKARAAQKAAWKAKGLHPKELSPLERMMQEGEDNGR